MNYSFRSTKIKACFKIAILVFLFILPFASKAQLDYIHYVPPLYNGSSNSGDIGKHVAVISTNSDVLIDVDIFKGGAITPFETIQVSKSAPYRYLFKTTAGNNSGTISNPTTYDFPFGVIGPNKLNLVLPDDGLKFRSYDSPVYVNIRHVSSVQGGSLTTKGRFAMGKEFRSGHVYTDDPYKSTSRRSHFLSVMATEDNTKVYITDLRTGILTDYLVPSVYSFDVPVSNALPEITLNKGESYAIAIDHNLTNIDGDKINDMNGTHIVSDKDIVVNTGSWTAGPNSGQDMGLDQIVPYDQIRDQYVVMKGKGDNRTERPIIVATVDDTYVYVNGSGSAINPSTPLAAGEYLVIPETYYEDPDSKGIPTMFIDTKDKNVYVYQTMSGSASTIGPTVGMNFIAPLAATGMHQVDVPFSGELAYKGVTAVITILAQNDANIKYSIDGGTAISLDENDATSIPGAPEWKSYKVNNVSGNLQFQAEKAINVAWTVQSGYIGSAGYYSGFSKAIPKIVTDLDVSFETGLNVVCESYDTNIEVGIEATPDPDFIEWYENEVKEENLIPTETKGKLVVPAPDVDTKYIVKAYFRDPALNINTNANINAGQVVFTTGFDLSEGNMQEPGTYGISTTPKVENSGFIDVLAEEGREKILIVYSDGQAKTIYEKKDMPIDRETNYIISVVGKMAKVDKPQLVDLYINEEKIKSNFLMNSVDKWQTVSALWKSKDNQKATIKLVDANASGVSGVFAIDTVAFAIAAEEIGEFNALVVPSYSVTPHDKPEHFCKGGNGNIDVSNEDYSWYNYKWERKVSEGVYEDIQEDNVTGKATHNLEFLAVTDANKGIYRCTITFNEDYQKCGEAVEPAILEVEVIIDELANIRSLTGNSDLCEGESAALEVNVEGKYSRIAWSVGGVEKAEGKVFDFNLDKAYEAGVYPIRCDVENACEALSQEVQIEIFGKPNLTDLQVPEGLCDQKSVNLTAVGPVLAGATMEYSWYRGATLMATNNLAVFPVVPNMSDSYYKVAVAAHYNIGDADNHTCIGNEKIVNLVAGDIYPQVVLTNLTPVIKCEGLSHLYKAELETSGNYYAYLWETPSAVGGDKSSADLSLTDITTDMAGSYKVTVTNRCGTANSTSTLSIKPKSLLTGVSFSKDGPYCSGDFVTVTINDIGFASAYKATNSAKGINRDLGINKSFDITVDALTEGVWQVTAINDCGDIKTSFTIDLVNSFTLIPIDTIKACVGDNLVTLEAIVETPPAGITYQWKDQLGNDLVDETSSTLVFNPVKLTDAGDYTCVVSDGICSTQQAIGTLSIDDVTTVNLTPGSLDICEGLTHHFEVSYVGNPTFAWFFTGADNVKTNLNISTSSYNTPLLDMADAGLYSCEITTGCGLKVFKQTLNILTNVTVTKDPSVISDICEGEHTTLILNVTGSYASIKWYKDGSELTGELNKKVISTEELGTSGTFEYKYIVEGSCGPVEGTFDVTVHDKPSINAIADINDCNGNDIPLAMTVVGADYIQESWLNPDNSLLLDELTATITGATYPTSSGNYTAKVTTDYCGDITTIAKVNVYKPINVLSNSELNPTPCVGDPLSLSVTGEGDALSYQWYKDVTPLAVQPDENILDLGAAVSTDQATYTCELISGNGCGNVNVIFDVDVREHAKITLQPTAKTPCEGDASVTFIVSGTAEGTLSYKWHKNNIEINDGPDFTGTNTTNLIVSNLSLYDNDLFHCKISGDFCTPVFSDQVSLNVIKDITMTPPTDQTIDENESATFSVTATGGGTITYQWFEKTTAGGAVFVSMGSSPASAQTASLTLASVPFSKDGYEYRCEVTNGNACDTKNGD
uniref:hypothetical protein n=1 Tax=Ancylomarina sp. TaxID=1970196 RepID=UPI0035694A63